jgi:UDP-N-acetylmuramate dehydrogenase
MQNIKNKFNDIIHENLPLSKHTSFRIGGSADLAAFPRTKEELSSLLALAKAEGVKTLVVGNASNMLFDDAGFRGLVIFTTAMKNVTWGDDYVEADAGASLTAIAGEAARRGLSGLEFAYGIPATIGGAVYMNAGAYGSEIACALTESTYFDGEAIRTRTLPEHEFSYRKSIYQKSGETVLSARFAFRKENAEEIRLLCEERMNARKEKQPLEFPSAGSVFKRPEGYFAGALIEQCGLKGYRIGGAEVSEKHAGFIINRGGATSADVLALIEHIRSEVMKKFGVYLEMEVIHIKP